MQDDAKQNESGQEQAEQNQAEQNDTDQNNSGQNERTWVEEIEVAGNQLVDRVKELVAEGNVRRLIIRKPGGDILMEIPLTAGVAVGGVFAVFAPIFAALGALAALVADFKVEVVRVEDSDTDEKSVQQIEIEQEPDDDA